MKEHAIPQDITGYKFHIVGNMTLKQFAEVAIGVVVAFFIYKTNLIDFVKYPLVLLSGGLGAALAFLPIAERPLDHWLVTFFTILYKPTKFFWKKEPRVPDAFLYKPKTEMKKQEDFLDLTPQRRQRISEFLKSVKTPQVLTQEDLKNKQRSGELLSIFEDQTLKINFSKIPNVSKKPNLKVRVRSLVDTSNRQTSGEKDLAETVVFSSSDVKQVSPSAVAGIQPNSPQQRDFLTKKALSTSQVASEIKIPELEKIKVEKSIRKEEAVAVQNGKNQTKETSFSTAQNTAPKQQTVAATKDTNLPFPTKPTQANKLVGMILTKNNELVDGATVTISNENNLPMNAIKSNALGQFFISSELKNGSYIISIKKHGLTFRPVQIALDGEIVEPLDIRSDQ